MAVVTIIEGVIQILPPLALNAGGSTAWSAITGKPTEFPPEPHTHAIGSVVDLQAALDAKAAVSHAHAIGDTAGLQAALDAKAATSHAHAIGDVTGLQAALDAKIATGAVVAIVTLSQVAYDALTPKVSTTLYLIT